MNPFITYIIQTTVAISLFYLLYWLFLRKETFFGFNRYYFIISILTSLALPFLELSRASVLKDSPVKAITGSYYYLENNILPATSTIGSSEATVQYTLTDIVTWIYIAIAAFLLFRLIFQAAWFVRKIRKSKKIELSGMRIVLDENVVSPFSFFSWIFMNPEQAGEESMQEILLHEKEHILQWHSLDLVLTELLVAFQWFNPFVWLLRRSVKETLEYLADRAVLRQGVPVVDYQKLLLSYAMGLGHPSLITPLNFSLNKKRMIMMKKMKSPGIRKWKSLAFLPLVLILGLSFSNPFTGERTPLNKEKKDVRQASDSTDTLPDAPVYILKGKVISKPDFQSIDPESIQAINVWRGEKAVEKYGNRAAGGAIEVTLKPSPENTGQQKYEVTGRVLNAGTGDPLPDVNIVIKNTSNGTVSREGGRFTLPMEKESAEAWFSYVGFMPVSREVKSGEEIEVQLKRRPAMMILPPATDEPWEQIAREKQRKSKTAGNPEFVVVEDMAYFPGSQQALSNYIASAMKYPAGAKKKGISGRVWVNFTIDENGNVRNVYIDRGIDPDLDKEAVRIISEMPKWEPGRQRGKAVPVELNVNVDFIL